MKKKYSINIKAFTLIELLAVIIILGILMIIAIPSVTTYINNSRKSAYVNTAKEIISGVRNLINEGKLETYDTNVTYYIPYNCIKTENSVKTPYGEFTEAYVGVVYNGKGYNYYWISVDNAGQGVKYITPESKLDEKLIESNIDYSEINDIINSTGIDDKKKIRILQTSCNTWGNEKTASIITDSNGVIKPKIITFVTRQNENEITVNDEIIFGEDNFYVVSSNSSETVLLAKYDLNHSNKQETSGKNNNVKLYSFLDHSKYAYWDKYEYYWTGRNWYSRNRTGGLKEKYSDGGKKYCYNLASTNCAYVYDNSNLLSNSVNSYANSISSKTGIIVTGRLISLEEAAGMSKETRKDHNNTTYWTGTVAGAQTTFLIGNGVFGSQASYNTFAVRPVLVVPTNIF